MLSPAGCRPAEYHKKFKSLVEKYLWRDCPAGVVECFCNLQMIFQMSEAHSDKSLKKLSFLRRQCAVLSPMRCRPAEYHRKIISLVEAKHLQRDCSTEYLKLIPTNH
jgi:hypothetical protein